MRTGILAALALAAQLGAANGDILHFEGFNCLPGNVDACKFNGTNMYSRSGSAPQASVTGFWGKSVFYQATTTAEFKVDQPGSGRDGNGWPKGSYSQSEIMVGFHFRITSNAGVFNTSTFPVIWENAGINHALLRMKSTGEIELIDGDGTLLDTSPDPLADATWYWIECYMKLSDTDGAYECRLDGTTIFAGTGADTLKAPATGDTVPDALEFHCSSNSFLTPTHWDDLVIWETSGGPTWKGEMRVESYKPTATATNNWTANGICSNHSCIDEGPPDSSCLDSQDVNQYLFTDTWDGSIVGRFTFDFTVPTFITIPAVRLWATARRTGGQTGSITPMVRIGGTTYTGTAWTDADELNFAYGTPDGHWEQYDTDPDTGLPWTAAALDNSAEFGFRADAATTGRLAVQTFWIDVLYTLEVLCEPQAIGGVTATQLCTPPAF